MRICPIRAMALVLAVTALVTLDGGALSVIAGLLPIALIAALAFGHGRRLDAAIRWLRRRLRTPRRSTPPCRRWVASQPLLASRAIAGAHPTRGPPA